MRRRLGSLPWSQSLRITRHSPPSMPITINGRRPGPDGSRRSFRKPTTAAAVTSRRRRVPQIFRVEGFVMREETLPQKANGPRVDQVDHHKGRSRRITFRQRPTLPHTDACSTIGAEGLNCRVRNGNGCIPLATATGKAKFCKERLGFFGQLGNRVSSDRSRRDKGGCVGASLHTGTIATAEGRFS